MSKDRPILFSAPMVRAILAGTKTQTRRVAKPQRKTGLGDLDALAQHQYGLCPYGKPGDRLWVRETFRGPLDDGSFGYRATHDGPFTWHSYTWKPSIHMPRAASRITLEITDVRVERLQDISEEDAIAEGIELLNGRYTFNGGLHESRTAVESYQALWEQLNGSESWWANPFVWVISFRRIEL